MELAMVIAKHLKKKKISKYVRKITEPWIARYLLCSEDMIFFKNKFSLLFAHF
jgi:hypothetical protein